MQVLLRAGPPPQVGAPAAPAWDTARKQMEGGLGLSRPMVDRLEGIARLSGEANAVLGRVRHATRSYGRESPRPLPVSD